MATRTQKLKVFLFLAVCGALMAGGLITVAGLYEHTGLHYWIEFDESVLGLGEGSVVVYQGVPVGKVEGISVTDSNLALVDVLIDPEKVRLKQGVEAQLVIYSLAAGTMAVSLSGGDPVAPPLPNHTAIPAKVSTIAAVSTRLEELMENLNAIAMNVRSGLEGIEEGQLTAVVDNFDGLLTDGRGFIEKGGNLVEEATTTVADLRDKAQTVIERFDALSTQVEELAGSLNTLAKNINSKVTEVDLAGTQGQLNKALENVAQITERVNEAVGRLGAVTNSAMHEADNVQHSLDRALRDASIALDSINALVGQLKDDPASLIRGKGKPQGAP